MRSSLQLRKYVVPKTEVFIHCSRDFFIELPQKRRKIDNKVAMPIIGKLIHTSHGNCNLKAGNSYQKYLVPWYALRILKSNF